MDQSESGREGKARQSSKAAGSVLLIGWKEFIDFPEWNIRQVKTKIDTGARTSALDAVSYRLWQTAEEGMMAELCLALRRKHPECRQTVRVRVVDMVDVRNSGGVCEPRPVVETTIRLGPVTKRVRLTVTNRATMLFRLILGRKALEGDFIVDVGKKYLLRSRQ
jgi:hypothetical protein